MKLKQVEEEYYKYEDSTNPVSHAPDAKASIYPPSIQKEIDGLNKEAPQSVKDAINSLILPANEGKPTNDIVQLSIPSPK